MKCKICSNRKKVKKMLEGDCDDVTNSQTGWNEREYRRAEYIKKLKEFCPKCHKGIDEHHILHSTRTNSLNQPHTHNHGCRCGWKSEDFEDRFVNSDLTDTGYCIIKPRKLNAGVTLVFHKCSPDEEEMTPRKEGVDCDDIEDTDIDYDWGHGRH